MLILFPLELVEPMAETIEPINQSRRKKHKKSFTEILLMGNI